MLSAEGVSPGHCKCFMFGISFFLEGLRERRDLLLH